MCLHASKRATVVTHMRYGRRGFSLVELLVVLAIIAVVLAVAVPVITTARLNGVETMVVREVQAIRSSVNTPARWLSWVHR